MIRYRSAWSLRVADCWYARDAGGVKADIFRFLHLAEPLEGCSVQTAETVRLDLARTEDELLADMPKSNRNHLRKAADCGFRYEFWFPAPKSATLELCEKVRTSAPEILQAYAEQGALDISRVSDQNGRPLAWRAHYRDPVHARAIYSATLPEEQPDPALRNLLARARRHHYWEDIRRFRGGGIQAYDFGRRYAETDDQSLLAENFFQDGFGGGLAKTYSCTRAGSLRGRVVLALNIFFPFVSDSGC